jgi:hypothetical protein
MLMSGYFNRLNKITECSELFDLNFEFKFVLFLCILNKKVDYTFWPITTSFKLHCVSYLLFVTCKILFWIFLFEQFEATFNALLLSIFLYLFMTVYKIYRHEDLNS